MHYDENQDGGNLSMRESLFVPPNNKTLISVPFGTIVSQKNEFWDLTNCANELDKYNKENNIRTISF